MKKNDFMLVFSLVVIVIFSLAFVSAITGSLGNARMVLRMNSGESLDKSVLIKNVNDEPIRIQFSVSGDLNQSIKVKTANNFTLNAGESKNVEFTIKATKSGTTESKINFMFSPIERTGSGVGLSSTIVVITDGADANDSVDNTNNIVDNVDEGTDNTNSASITDNIKIKIPEMSALGWMLTSSGVLFLFLLILFLISVRAKKRRGEIKVKKRPNAE